jgi:hypothetical protein
MTETILFNFRTPVYLKASFEKSCIRRNVTMTSQLNILIHDFINQDQHKQQEVLLNEYEPISILSSNHYYEDIEC